MTIANAVVKGTMIYIYDEKGKLIRQLGMAGGTFVGFTATTVSIKKGSHILIYNEQGKQTGTMPAR